MRDPLPLLATVLIIVFGKSVAAFAIVRLFGYPTSHALTISASLAQIGEFSFILAGLGVSLALLPERGPRPDPGRRHHLDPAQSACCLPALDWYLAKHKPPALEPAPADSGIDATAESASREPMPATHATNHVVLIGYGRVGRIVAGDLKDKQMPFAPDRGDQARCAAGA